MPTASRRSAVLGLGALLAGLVTAAVASPAQAADTAPRPSHIITPIAGSGIAAAGINDRGQVVGVTSVVEDTGQFVPVHGFLWQHGRTTDLGVTFQPTAINNQGHILGRTFTPGGGAISGYGLWRDGTVTALGTLGGEFLVGMALNDRDEVVGYGTLADGSLRGFVWRSGTMTALPPVAGGFSSLAFDINNNGDIVGASRAPDRSHGVRWRDGNVTDLGPGMQIGYLINDQGQIAGYGDGDGIAHALLLRHGTVTDLGDLGVDFTAARGINNHTVIVGDGQVVEGQPVHAFRWANGRIVDLGEGYAGGINNGGQIAVNRPNPARVEILG
jgi:probable HAF family extracellular repeat protein